VVQYFLDASCIWSKDRPWLASPGGGGLTFTLDIVVCLRLWSAAYHDCLLILSVLPVYYEYPALPSGAPATEHHLIYFYAVTAMQRTLCLCLLFCLRRRGLLPARTGTEDITALLTWLY